MSTITETNGHAEHHTGTSQEDKPKRTRTPRPADQPARPSTPRVQLDDEAKAYLAALGTLAAMPLYSGPTVDEVVAKASEAASKAVIAAYTALMGKAK